MRDAIPFDDLSGDSKSPAFKWMRADVDVDMKENKRQMKETGRAKEN